MNIDLTVEENGYKIDTTDPKTGEAIDHYFNKKKILFIYSES